MLRLGMWRAAFATTTMLGLADRIIACVVAITMALNALLCACSSPADTQAALQVQAAAPAGHCHGDGQRPATQDPTPAEHDASCQHCSGWDAVQPADSGLAAAIHAGPPPAFLLLPTLVEATAPPLSHSTVAALPSRIGGAPTLLRQHCALIV